MVFILYRIGIYLALRTDLKKAYRVASRIGRAYSFFSFRDRWAVRDNLKVILPSLGEREIAVMSREPFINFCKYLVDFFRYPLIDDDYIKENVKNEGLEYLNKALGRGKGVILLSAHLGNWELGAAVLAKMGYKLNAVTLTHRHKDVDAFFAERRQMVGMKPIPFGGALRRCFKCLSQNETLALVGDRDYFNNGVQTPLFGKDAMIPKGPAALSLRFHSPIIPVFMVRNANDTFILKVCPEIEYAPSGDEDKDIRLLTAKCSKIIEDIVRQYPTQWYVFRRFWEKIGWKL